MSEGPENGEADNSKNLAGFIFTRRRYATFCKAIMPT
jgi:hypothetical protein